MADQTIIEANLKELPAKLADVRSALIATLDGITIASIAVDEKTNQLAAMTAAALGLGKRMIETISAGALGEISITGSGGSVFVYSLGTKAVLVVVTKPLPNVALVNWESKKLIAQLGTTFV